jgi:hypothetical protein
VKPNLTPYDKFKPENETRAYQYLYMLSWHSPERVKFGDEKCLKGQELFTRFSSTSIPSFIKEQVLQPKPINRWR